MISNTNNQIINTKIKYCEYNDDKAMSDILDILDIYVTIFI